MANEAAKTQTINIVPVQGIFQPEPTFALISLIGPAGTPFYPIIDPNQSGINITNSTINSTTIGAITPSTGVFTDISTTTGQVTTTPSANTDIANKFYVDTVAQGLGPKAACAVATLTSITLSGLQSIDGYTTLAGDRVLVKNQGTSSQNGIYIASASAWTRSTDMDVWSEVPGAYTVILNGGQANTGWVCTAASAGTINVTGMPWVQFSGSATYFAGTGLTLSANTFSITNTGVTAASVGSASKTLTATVNAQGQLTVLADTNIAITNTQVSGLGTMSTQNANAVAITSGTIDAVTIGGSNAGAITGTTITANTQFSGAGTGLTGTASGLSIGGNAATATTAGSATTAVTATNLAGGAAGSVPYQSAPSTTTFLSVGANGQVLTLASGVPSWATPTTGTVTSVSGTGTVSGISLSGTVTSSGNLTLGGTLDLSAPPAIGGTTANTVTGTTITATTKFVGPFFEAATSAGGALRNSGGTSQLSWGAGGGDNLTLSVSTNINGTNAQIDISPTGTGHVHIKPTGVNSVEIAPTSIGTINNMSIGATTAAAGFFTTLSLTGTLSVNSSTGTTGQVLQSNGSSAPTWVTPVSYATVTDDTTTASTRYPLFASATAGNLTTEFVSSTKLQYVPSSGVLTATGFSGSGASLTSLTAGNLSGTIPSAVLGNSTVYIGTTAVALNRASASISLTGTNIDGSAGSATTATTATNATNVAVTDNTSSSATWYPTFVSTTTGNLPITVASTKLKFTPSTGALTASQLIIAP